MNDRTNGATAPLDCTTPLHVLTERDASPSSDAFIEAEALIPEPDWALEQRFGAFYNRNRLALYPSF